MIAKLARLQSLDKIEHHEISSADRAKTIANQAVKKITVLNSDRAENL